MLVQVAQGSRNGGARRRSVAAEHPHGLLPEGNPTAQTVASREGHGSGFFQRCLANSRGATPAEWRLWREGIYDQIREVMSMPGSLSIEHMCRLISVTRRGFYRPLQERQPAEEEMGVRSVI